MVSALQSQTNTRPSGEAAPEEVLSLLDRQASLYAALEGLAQRQQRLVAEDSPGPLLELLAARQKVASDLTKLAAPLEPIRRNWREFVAGLTMPQRTRAESLLADMDRRLRRVIESDERDARMLAGRKELIAHQLRDSQSGGRALTAYQPTERGGIGDRLDEAS